VSGVRVLVVCSVQDRWSQADRDVMTDDGDERWKDPVVSGKSNRRKRGIIILPCSLSQVLGGMEFCVHHLRPEASDDANIFFSC